MALDSATISSMYRKYLGRDASAKDIATVTAKGFAATPESLQSLLTNTASSIRKKAMGTADANIKALTGDQQPAPLASTSTSIYGGKLPDYATFQGQNPELQQAQGEYNDALSRYGDITERAAAQPQRSREQLKAGSYFFGESYDDIQKRYSDPASPYFIPNPDDRNALIDRSMQQRNATLQDTISKISSIYDVLATAAANEVAGKKDQVSALQKMVEKTYDGLMSFYGEERAMEFEREQNALNRNSRNKGPSPADTEEKFNSDVQTEVQNVLSGVYGTKFARESAITSLTAKYPGRAQQIKDLIYGTGNPGAGKLGPSSPATNGLLPDGYESQIQPLTRTYTSDTGTNPF